jgi:hypothetical protein
MQLTIQLFFGIRGGGCNFGVVTEFNFRMHSLPPLCWGGLLTFSMDQMEDIYGAMRVWQDTVQTEDEGAWIMATTKPLGGGQVRSSSAKRKWMLIFQHEKTLMLVCWHIGPEVVATERYKIFLDLGMSDHFDPYLFSPTDADKQVRSRMTPRKCHMPKSTSSSINETPTAYATT